MPRPRIAPVPTPLAAEDAQRMTKLVPSGMAPPQLFLAAARNSRLWAFMVDSGLIGPTGLMDLRSMPPRLRETVILRTCVANRCDYEFNLHVQTISERMGLAAEQIDDVRRPAPNPACWSAAELAVMALVDALVLRRALTDAEFDDARAHHSEEALIEIAHLVGLYTGVAMLAAVAQPAFDLYRQSRPVLASLPGAAA